MARRKKDHMPKRIAGVKVPKSVRRGPLGELLASPVGVQAAGDAIVVASGALIAHQLRRGSEARRTLRALEQAARRFAEALQEGAPGTRSGPEDAPRQHPPSSDRP